MASVLARLIVSLLVVFPAAATAQSDLRVSRAKLVAVNAAIGGMTAGVSEAAHRRSFWRGFLKGSAGGLTVYGGKCLIGQKHRVTDWLGRGTVAMGSSMIANAAAGRPEFGRIAIPLGPIRFYRDNATAKTTVRLDVMQTGAATYLALKPETKVDWKASFRHGGLVLFDKVSPTALEVGGVVRVWNVDSKEQLAHEQTHVAQEEFVTTVLEEPIEGWLLRNVRGGTMIHRYFDIGVLAPVWAGVNAVIPKWDRPWEKEAMSFAEGC